MDSQKNVTVMEDIGLKNVEHRKAEDMVNPQIDLLDQLQQNKLNPVVHYVGNKAQSLVSKILPFSAEMVMFLYMFSYTVRSTTATTMLMDKVCAVHLGHSEDTCSNLKDHPLVKPEVEKMANNYHLGHTVIQLVPSAFLALFIGSWSDKYGRKFPLIVAMSGIIVDGVGTTLCAYFIRSRAAFYFIPALFTGLSGGFIGVLIVLYSYASDVSTSGKRTMKYAFMELAYGLAIPLGSLAGGWIYKYYHFVPVFVVSTCCNVLNLCLVIFVLEETRGLENKDSWRTKFHNFWSLDAVISSFRTTAKRRPNRGNVQIWLIIISMGIAFFSFTAVTGIAYFYAFQRYDWENTKYSTISAIYSVIGLSMMMIIVPITKKKNISDPILGIVGSASTILKNIGIGLAYKTWIYHLANIAGFFGSLGNLAGRSRISKIVPKDDLGKVFAFLTTAECIFPIASMAITSQAFNATLEIFPGLMYIVMGLVNVIPLSIFIWISRLPVVNYEEMIEEETMEKEIEKKVEETLSTKH